MYNTLIQLESFEERLKFLQEIQGEFDRIHHGRRIQAQEIYQSKLWKDARREAILRDEGCDLGIFGFGINGRVLVHHISPITDEDVINNSPKIYDINNLITVSKETHEAIHYGFQPKIYELNERTPGDTKLW